MKIWTTDSACGRMGENLLRHDITLHGIGVPDIESMLKTPDRNKIYVGVEKPLFHSASMSGYSSALTSISPKPFAKISRELGARLSLSDGDYVTISTSSGSLELPVMLLAGMTENIVLVPNNFEGAGVCKILVWKMNETIKAPALDRIEVSVKKIERAGAEGQEVSE